ncbi:MAG TPA: hypothetical protein VF530_03810 [Planctomycetota bacterium]
MRPAPLVLALVALAAAIGVGWLVVNSQRSPSATRSEESSLEDVAPASSLAPSAVTPAATTHGEGAHEELAPSVPGEQPSEARIPAGTIRGRVVGVPPELRGRLEVIATPVDASHRKQVTPCDPEGCFTLAGLEPEQTYDLRVVIAGRVSFGRPRTELRMVSPGPPEIELRWFADRALLFQVADARTGLAVTEFEVRLGRRHVRPLLDEEGRIRRHFPEGRVRWVAWAEEEEREPFELVVSARGYRELRVGALVDPVRNDYDLGRLLLEPVPRLVVRVVDEATQLPVEGARVTLMHAVDKERPRDAQAFDPHGGRTDAEGRVTLSCFPGEEAVLSVRHSRYADLDRTLALTLAEEQLDTVQLAPR